MIGSYKNKTTEALRQNKRLRKFPADVHTRAQRKLALLDAATTLDDLRVPPSNRLEALKGNRKGQFSIRINDQWRICFVWNSGTADNVEVVDYH